MSLRWLARLGSLSRVLQRPAPAIPPTLWDAVVSAHPFLAWRCEEDQAALRTMAQAFLQTKEFHGAQGFAVTDEVAVSVAAQACLPVLRLGLKPYSGFVGIVMHEGPVLARREVTDEQGLIHTWDEELVGEAVEGGPVMLSWNQGAAPEDDRPTAFNVVIHEFAHLLDLGDGALNGIPAIGAELRHRWEHTLMSAFDRFDERSACGYESVIDDYGAQDPVEFFAVTCEAFFTRPRALAAEMDALYACYRDYFRQDPAATSGEFSGIPPEN